MSEQGSWIADVREDFDQATVGHAVVVDGVSPDGMVLVRDPWPVKNGQLGTTGTTYMVTWDEFFARWSGVYTFSPQVRK